MVGVVIVTHGKLADILLDTAELIAGKQEQVMTLAFAPGENAAALQLRIREAIKQVDMTQGVLVVADLVGGSPYNAAAIVAMQQTGVEVVAGVNLAMLLELLPARGNELEVVTEIALKGGCDGIGRFVMPKNG
jgi:mannose/fructose/sorbose-specific phosphotransferase system IIA component